MKSSSKDLKENPKKSRSLMILFFKDLGDAIFRNQTFDLAAELGYWSTLSLFPFAIVLLSLIGFIPLEGPLGEMDQKMTELVYQAMPTDAARLVDKTAHEVVGQPRGWLLVVSLLGAIWSASSAVSATITALNRAYEVQETRPFWWVKLLSLVATLGAALLILVSVSALILGPKVIDFLAAELSVGDFFHPLWVWARWPIVILSMVFMMACVYYFLPNVKQKFRLISPGSVTAVLLWVLASLGFDYYVSHFHNYAVTYGALGTAVILMTWLYISGWVVILGSEVNASLDRVVRGIKHSEQGTGELAEKQAS
jgi:membrane protein